eukprot:GHUV01030649.1.p1 GENE.GHUV01030649.1~~GHUV01030649.1.p1  ORF type:complete len:101 (+),score=9.44 GHUV01030649.1:755-1057(+)
MIPQTAHLKSHVPNEVGNLCDTISLLLGALETESSVTLMLVPTQLTIGHAASPPAYALCVSRWLPQAPHHTASQTTHSSLSDQHEQYDQPYSSSTMTQDC